MVKRSVPYNQEAEQSVLGAILVEESNIARADEILSVEDFYKPVHRKIFQAMLTLHEERKPIDPVTLSSKLGDLGDLEEVGGAVYLAHLINEVPLYFNIDEYCHIVHEKAIVRALIDKCTHILEMCYGTYNNIDDIIEEAEHDILEVGQGKSRKDFSDIKNIVAAAVEQMEERAENAGKLTGLSTGFKELDVLTSGLQKSDLIFIAARPSMGKTAFALNLASHAALHEKATVALFSLEMSEVQLVNRMICAEALIDASKVRDGSMQSEDWEKVALAYQKLYETSVFIDDTAGISLPEIRSKCRRMQTEHGLDLILIDYLQLMSGRSRAENRQNEVSEISRGLKALAREMDCPIVCLSQLSRAPDARNDHHPMLADLRESGSIEQDADVVMFLYRDYYYNKEEGNPNIAELDIAKQRNGPTQRINLSWLPEYTRFMDPAPSYYNEEISN